ncbi:MAG: hypothetical protein WCI00_02530 [bacterium]
METQEEVYKNRVKNFVKQIKKVNPEWITKRSWFEDLRKFELGQNFFEKVVHDDIGDPDDKGDFYAGIVIYALINLKGKMKSKDDHLEAGFKVESDINDAILEERHEMVLGFYWWKTIYKAALKAGQFDDTEEFDELEKKFNDFCIQINRIEPFE